MRFAKIENKLVGRKKSTFLLKSNSGVLEHLKYHIAEQLKHTNHTHILLANKKINAVSQMLKIKYYRFSTLSPDIQDDCSCILRQSKNEI